MVRQLQGLPPHLLVAAAIVFAQGAVGMATLLWGVLATGDLGGTLRPGLNALTMLCIGWGLVTRQPWGWWLGVLVVGFRAALALVALGAIAVFSVAEPAALAYALLAIEEASGQRVVWLLVWLVFLVAAFVLLMSPPVRAVFRAPKTGSE